MIRSLLDNDLYKFTMQQAVLALYPDANVTYKFINRRAENKFTKEALAALKERIKGDPTWAGRWHEYQAE